MPTKANIFGERHQYQQTAFTTSENMVLVVGGNKEMKEYLVQGISLQFASPGQPLFEIGSNHCYMAPASRGRGSMQIEKIIGRYKITSVLGQEGKGIWTTDDGEAGERIIRLYSMDENGGAHLEFTAEGCKVDQYSAQFSATGKLISESAVIQFLNLYFDEGTGGN